MKSPAFQFYPSDFLGSGKVAAMTTDEIGAYLLLLCLDWSEGGFVFDETELARITRLPTAKFRKAWARISRCFVERRGRLWNPRLDKERQKQTEWRRKSSKGGKLSAQRRLKGGSRVVEPPYAPPTQPKGNSPSPSPSPVTTTAKESAGAIAPRPVKGERPRPDWLVPISVVWEKHKGAGTFQWGKAGKHLKPLHDAGHSGDRIAANLGRYIPLAGKYVSLPRFAETFADYDAVRLTGPAIVDGWLSPEVERLTRPAGYVA